MTRVIMRRGEIKRFENKLEALHNKSNKGASGRKKVDVLNDLAFVICISDPQKAENYARQGLTLAKKLDYTKGIASGYSHIGISYYTRGKYDKAMKYSLLALENTAKSNKRNLAQEYNNIAMVYEAQARYDKALEYYHNAMKINEEIGNRFELAKCYNNIGCLYETQVRYDKALEYYHNAMKINEEFGDKEMLAVLLSNIGRVYHFQGKYDKAEEYYHNAVKIYEEIGDKDGLASICNWIGELHEKQGDYGSALDYAFKSLKLFEEIGNKHGITTCYSNIGAIQAHLSIYDEALINLRKSLQMARANGFKLDEMMNCESLSKLLEKQRKFAQALHYYKKHHDIKQEIFNDQKSKQIAEMTAIYETEKKEKKAEIYRLKNVELRKEIRKRKKAEKELEEHRDQLEKIVAKRTAKLKATNMKLKKEIATRRRAEKELINYQKQLRSLAHELSLVEERQRRKIATNLHDSISQSLMIVKSSLEILASTASNKNMKKQLKEVQAHVTQMIQRTRSMTFEISPPVLYELGLEPAMEWLAESFQEQHGISCEFHDDGVAKPVNTDWRCILFQSTRELLANVRKHAKANKVLISTGRDGKLIRITVKDDGIGFDPKVLSQKIRNNEGFGLFNLKERLTYLKGSVEIDSEKGKGTTVTLLAPLKRGKRAATRMQA